MVITGGFDLQTAYIQLVGLVTTLYLRDLRLKIFPCRLQNLTRSWSISNYFVWYINSTCSHILSVSRLLQKLWPLTSSVPWNLLELEIETITAWKVCVFGARILQSLASLFGDMGYLSVLSPNVRKCRPE